MLSASMRDMEDKLYKAHGQIKTQTKEVNTLIKQKEQMDLGTKKAALDKHIEMYTDLESKYKIMKKKLKREKDLTEEKEVELLSLQKELDHQKK